MATNGNYRVDTRAMAEVLTSISSVLQQLNGAVGDVGALQVPTGCFGGLGTSVGTGTTTMQAQSGAALLSLYTALSELNQRLRHSLDGYQRADRDIAAALRALTPPQRTGPFRL